MTEAWNAGKGYGFVTLPTPAAAQRAIAELSGTMVEERQIEVTLNNFLVNMSLVWMSRCYPRDRVE